jgi:hypothetical protein
MDIALNDRRLSYTDVSNDQNLIKVLTLLVHINLTLVLCPNNIPKWREFSIRCSAAQG